MQLQHTQFSDPAETLQKAARAVDEETGIIKLLYEPPPAPDAPTIFGCGSLCSDYSHLGCPSGSSISGSTSLVRDQAIAGAIGEAIERYSAAFVPYEEIIVRPYSLVKCEAISPWSLTLYEAEQYQRSGFGYAPLTAYDPIGWVTGYSLTRAIPILVPAFAVYQPYRSMAGEAAVVQQITTGMACGSTLEEAILAAICEVVERDAAMLMWLQTRRPSKVVVTRGKNSCLASRALSSFGVLAQYVTILDVTTDISIPSYVAVWDGPIDKNQGAVFASCGSLSPERAVVGALTELAQSLMWVGSLLDNQEHLPDPRVEEMSRITDHVLWPMRPEVRPLFAFTLSSERSVSVSDRPDVSSPDVLDCIQKCVDLVGAQGLEVIVIDVTSPDIRELGLHVVRVIIPGAQPLFFGTGLHRLSERSHCSQYADRASERINLNPHPFP